MNTPEIDSIPVEAVVEVAKKAPKNLQWLVKKLRVPMSVRQLHLRTKISKKRLRGALVQLKMLDLVEEHQLPGGGSVWKVRVKE